MNTLLGRKGVGCAAVPSPDELEGLKAAAAKAQEATLRYATIAPPDDRGFHVSGILPTADV